MEFCNPEVSQGVWNFSQLTLATEEEMAWCKKNQELL
jgi:hypothetical protein